MVNAWQWGFITRGNLLALDGSSFGVGAPAVTFEVLDWKVVTIFHVALSQLLSHQMLAGQFGFDFLEAFTAFDSLFSWTTASVGDLDTGRWIHAPGVASRSVILFSAEVTVFGATWSVEAWHTSTTALFHDLSGAWAFLQHGSMHGEGGDARLAVAIDYFLRSRSSAGAFDFFTSVLVDTPALTNRAPVLFGGEETVIGAGGNEITNDFTWTQCLGTLDVAHGACSEHVAARDFSSSIGYDAPAFAN